MTRLIDNTVLTDPATGQPVTLAKGEELPSWAKGMVGDHLLEASKGASKRRGRKATAAKPEPEAEAQDAEADVAESDSDSDQ